MDSTTKHRREGAFDMSSEEQSNLRTDGLGANPDHSKLFPTLDNRQPEQDPESHDLATQDDPVILSRHSPSYGGQHALAEKPAGSNATGHPLATQMGKRQEGGFASTARFDPSLTLLIARLVG
jgi:hypothetical protein